MFLTGNYNIKEVILFPAMKPDEDEEEKKEDDKKEKDKKEEKKE